MKEAKDTLELRELARTKDFYYIVSSWYHGKQYDYIIEHRTVEENDNEWSHYFHIISLEDEIKKPTLKRMTLSGVDIEDSVNEALKLFAEEFDISNIEPLYDYLVELFGFKDEYSISEIRRCFDLYDKWKELKTGKDDENTLSANVRKNLIWNKRRLISEADINRRLGNSKAKAKTKSKKKHRRSGYGNR